MRKSLPTMVGLLLLYCPSLSAVDFSGPVVSVLDGDSIRVKHNGGVVEVRMNNIDCPEKDQA